MTSNPTNRFPRSAPRRGLSFFEFTGCFVAVIVGAVLGAMYLGVDVKGIALSVLEKTELIEPTGEESVAGVESTEIEQPVVAGDASTTLAENQDESIVPANEPAAEQTWQETITSAVNEHLPPEVPVEEQRKLTRAYWEKLLTALDESKRAAAKASQFSGQPQLYDLLANRKQVHVDTLKRMDDLDTHGVNVRVVSYSAAIKQWHQDGERLYTRAMDLLTDTAKAELSGPFAQSWQSAATQHRMEERLLKDRRAALENYVDHWLSEAE
ncbi:MAG: hypothetical protein RH917_11480 [Lacipirellulaceae bacterium]